jgi:hypothetical protein
MGGGGIVADQGHFGTDPDADPNNRIRTSTKRIRMRIQEAQKHTDPTDPDLEHWYTTLPR